MYVAPQPEYPETKTYAGQHSRLVGPRERLQRPDSFTPSLTWPASCPSSPDPAAMETLRALAGQGVRYLVVHPDQAPLDAVNWQNRDRWLAESDTTLLPAGRWGSAFLYLINPYGDRLVTESAAAGDPFWIAWRPEPAEISFLSPQGERISLLAYNVSDRTPEIQLTLYWQADTPIASDVTVFVHSLDSSGAILAQADGPPLEGHYPTSEWLPGKVVQDNRLLPAGQSYLVGRVQSPGWPPLDSRLVRW